LYDYRGNERPGWGEDQHGERQLGPVKPECLPWSPAWIEVLRALAARYHAAGVPGLAEQVARREPVVFAPGVPPSGGGGGVVQRPAVPRRQGGQQELHAVAVDGKRLQRRF